MADKKVVQYKLVKHKWPDEIKAERHKRMKRASIIAACVLCFLGGFGLNGLFNKHGVGSDPTFQKLSEVYSIMNNKFYFGKDQKDFNDKLLSGAIDGMVNAGQDIHTAYMEPERSKEFASSMEGSYLGIGIEFYEQSSDTFIIARVYKDSPAAKAGIIKGDRIYKINDTVCKNMDADKVKSLITGKKGTKVQIEVIRGGKHIKIESTRDTVNNSVYTEIKGKTAIMEINSFAETTGEDVGKQLAEIKKQGCTGLVIDLRDNGGGYLTAAQQIASYLMKENTVIFKEVDTNGKTEAYKTLSDVEHYTFKNLVILINEDTASASEVLTAALKEQMNATIVGVKSYGKGTVQIPLTFKDGSMLKYTIGEWITPKGNKINNVGIQPDVKVQLDPAYRMGAPKLEKNELYKADSVSIAAVSVQTYLKFLGYPVDRTDEYFSVKSSEALKQYQKDNNMKVTGAIDKEVITALLSSTSLKWKANETNYDVQMKKAVELANGK